MLAEPRKSGFDLTAWLVPVAAILLAAGGIAIGPAALAPRRRRRRGSASPGGDPPLEPADAERLEADLARYDL